ncbi:MULTISPECIES: hypothetical protein [unclassified Mesorhizobium]|uniref:hypothetical protein n=2 Tax=Mesorhizobium TaxID=68287 RepID=UPI001128A317|nr:MULTISPECIES: hypothetical protein [unclassified Mesorhizobium]MCA0060436.1 hypothetical protein [Mesorhizobium sp. B261B1A]TPL03510.1 hypothetical protein FJ944_27560 [Mesorhizobium sp. B2-4-11]
MRKSTAVLASALVLCSSPAFAGDNNVLKIIQTSPPGALEGNVLSSDQSRATGSLVAGPTQQMIDNALGGTLSVGDLYRMEQETAPSALQTGQGNTATLTIEGDGGQLFLLQDNSAGGTLGNSAQLSAFGADSLGAVLQLGDGNDASLTVGGGATGLIVQNGSGNANSLTVGSGGSGEIVQNGNGNTFSTSVAANTAVTITQNGNNLSPVGVTGMQVFSTAPGTVSITQTGF